MFNSAILDVVVGLIFVFLVVSLVSSAVVESVSGTMKWRSATLLRGIKDLLNDPQLTGLAQQLYQHALINPRNAGTATTATDLSAPPLTRLWHGITDQGATDLTHNAPSYIHPTHFANALIDILNSGPARMISGDLASISGAIDHAVPAAANPQINRLLHGIAHRTSGDLGRMKDEIAAWFDNAMDRISGSYKRWSQRLNFWIALALAILLNISTIHVAKVLWQQPIDTKIISNVTKVLQPIKVDVALETLNHLQLPIGWSQYSRGDAPIMWMDLWDMIIGWLITAFAALFGAPFWFDLLQRVIRLKAAGPSPTEKATDSAASA